MGFLRNLFSSSRMQHISAQTSVDVIRRIRIDSGQRGHDDLSVIHAKNEEFMGYLLGVIDYLASQNGEPTESVVSVVVNELFGGNSDQAFSTIHRGAPALIDSVDKIQMQLSDARTPDQTVNVLRAFEKFF